MAGRTATFALVGSIESQCYETPLRHFLRIQSGTLFFHGSERMPYNQCRIPDIHIHIRRHIEVGNQQDVIPVFVEYLSHLYLVVRYECLWRFRYPFGGTDECHDFIDLSISQAVMFAVSDMNLQFVFRIVHCGKHGDSGKFPCFPVEIIPPEYIPEQMGFKILVNSRRKGQYCSLRIPSEQFPLVGCTIFHTSAYFLRSR